MAPEAVDILILGAGWTSDFLIPELRDRSVRYAATSTTGRPGTIRFKFDSSATPDDEASLAQYRALPAARFILISFPLTGKGQSLLLTQLYALAHPQQPVWSTSTAAKLPLSAISPSLPSSSTPPVPLPPAQEAEVIHFPIYIQFGTSSIFTAPHWNSATSPYDPKHPRAIAEDELLHDCTKYTAGAVVLNLAGLYGGARQPRDWVTRVAKSKEDVRGKGALHLVHGLDVARAVIRVCGFIRGNGDSGAGHVDRRQILGRRFILTDLHVYDWWDLIHAWDTEEPATGGIAQRAVLKGRVTADEGRELHYAQWVCELLFEDGVRALPRSTEVLGRLLDGRDFWKAVALRPVVGRLK